MSLEQALDPLLEVWVTGAGVMQADAAFCRIPNLQHIEKNRLFVQDEGLRLAASD